MSIISWRLRGELLRLERVVCANPECEEVFMASKEVCPYCNTYSPHKDASRLPTFEQETQQKRRSAIDAAQKSADQISSTLACALLSLPTSE